MPVGVAAGLAWSAVATYVAYPRRSGDVAKAAVAEAVAEVERPSWPAAVAAAIWSRAYRPDNPGLALQPSQTDRRRRCSRCDVIASTPLLG
jgi:hypothetical protein